MSRTTPRACICGACAIAWAATLPAHAANVALGKPVDLIGVFGTGSGYLSGPLPALPAATQITDGIAQGGGWTNGVWWDEHFTGVHNKIVIDLQGVFAVSGFGAMVDNNDMYLVEYRDAQGSWAPGWSIPAVMGQPGLVWRSIDLPASVLADAIRISAFVPSALGMDYAYSVSEVEVRAVPETSTAVMLGLGLLAVTLGVPSRRRPGNGAPGSRYLRRSSKKALALPSRPRNCLSNSSGSFCEPLASTTSR